MLKGCCHHNYVTYPSSPLLLCLEARIFKTWTKKNPPSILTSRVLFFNWLHSQAQFACIYCHGCHLPFFLSSVLALILVLFGQQRGIQSALEAGFTVRHCQKAVVRKLLGCKCNRKKNNYGVLVLLLVGLLFLYPGS